MTTHIERDSDFSWTSGPFWREFLSGSHESINYRSDMERNFPESSGYGSQIPKRLNTHYTMKLLSEITRLRALLLLLPISRTLAWTVAVICNTHQDKGISVSLFRMKAAWSRRPSCISVSDGSSAGKKCYKAVVLVHNLHHQFVSLKVENRRWPSVPNGTNF